MTGEAVGTLLRPPSMSDGCGYQGDASRTLESLSEAHTLRASAHTGQDDLTTRKCVRFDFDIPGIMTPANVDNNYRLRMCALSESGSVYDSAYHTHATNLYIFSDTTIVYQMTRL